MYPNFQRLLKVVQATEELPLGGFNMGCVVDACGTAGCLIGNYNALVGREPRTFRYNDMVLACLCTAHAPQDYIHFGISKSEYAWLFDGGPQFRRRKLSTNWSHVVEVTREQALRRLRKFLYYKLHKHELTYDEREGVSDRGRRAEGDQMFALRAVAAAVDAELQGVGA
jgi:hypothetical protein